MRDEKLETSPRSSQPAKLDAHELSQFTGSEELYRHSMNRDVTYTEGVKYLADKAGAYWLIDEIALLQRHAKVAAEGFQVWKLLVQSDRSAILTCDDGDGNIVKTRSIPFTDFPLDEVTVYCTGGTIMLPTEY